MWLSTADKYCKFAVWDHTHVRAHARVYVCACARARARARARVRACVRACVCVCVCVHVPEGPWRDYEAALALSRSSRQLLTLSLPSACTALSHQLSMATAH